MQKINKFIALIALAFATSCAAPQPPEQPPISFNKYPAINVNVANIEVVEAYKSPLAAPNIEHLMPYSPTDALKIWIKDRLKATGSEKLLQITIVDAAVTSTDLPKPTGFSTFFTVAQDKRYDARLEVEMRIYGDEPLSEADTSVTVTRNITIPENSSVASRKVAYEQMLHELMDMLNEKLERNMQTYFGNYVSVSAN